MDELIETVEIFHYVVFTIVSVSTNQFLIVICSYSVLADATQFIAFFSRWEAFMHYLQWFSKRL